jgi:putative heme transporter
MKKLGFKGWLTIITLILLSLVVFAAWSEIEQAWLLLDQIDLWVLALIIPVQLFSYFATGGMIFSYLRAKGDLHSVSRLRMTRIALELNFVNHVLPSGGAAGFSYLGWVLSKYGIRAGRSTMAQLIRFTLTFLSFIVLLLAAVLFLIIDEQINRIVIALCSILAVAALSGTIAVMYLLSSEKRLQRFSNWLTKLVNRFMKKITRGAKKNALKPTVLLDFFMDLHTDYVVIRKDARILIRPFIWAILANLADIALLWIAFWSLGYTINPAVLLVAFGLSSIAGAFTATPGGAGVYEAIMITFLASTGVPPDVAIAGTLLARVTLVLGTIVFGYVFYQHRISTSGRRPPIRQ